MKNGTLLKLRLDIKRRVEASHKEVEQLLQAAMKTLAQ